MRKLLPVALPIAVVAVLVAAGYLLYSLSIQTHVLGIKDVSAAHITQRSRAHIQNSVTVSTRTTPTPTTTKTPTPTPPKKPSPTPTKVSSPTPTKSPASTPTPTAAKSEPSISSVSLSSEQQFIMDEINKYRSSHGLSVVKSDKYTCDFAKTRAGEIQSAFNHDGFRDRINNKTLPYPSYSSVTENIAMTSDYKEVVRMWIESSGHAENMRRDTPYVCVEKNGNYYAYLGWRP